MDNRELVANAIFDSDLLDDPVARPLIAQHCGSAADAVIAALTEAGALLPELPENVRKIESLRLSDGSWCATTYFANELIAPIGFGPTIPAALADALPAKGGDDGE